MLRDVFNTLLNAVLPACIEVYGERLKSLAVFGADAERVLAASVHSIDTWNGG